MTSPKVTIHFGLITFNRSVIQASKQHHCVSLVNTNRMICNVTYLSQVMTLNWGQISFLTFLGHGIHHSTRLEALNTMVVKSLTKTLRVQSYDRKTNIFKIRPFWPFMTSGGQTVDLRSNLRAYYGKICKRAIECFFTSYVFYELICREMSASVGLRWNWTFGDL